MKFTPSSFWDWSTILLVTAWGMVELHVLVHRPFKRVAHFLTEGRSLAFMLAVILGCMALVMLALRALMSVR